MTCECSDLFQSDFFFFFFPFIGQIQLPERRCAVAFQRAWLARAHVWNGQLSTLAAFWSSSWIEQGISHGTSTDTKVTDSLPVICPILVIGFRRALVQRYLFTVGRKVYYLNKYFAKDFWYLRKLPDQCKLTTTWFEFGLF